MPYIVEYESVTPNRTLLGGVKKSATSRYESIVDAENRKDGIVQIHAELDSPVAVYAVVRKVDGPIDIYDDGSCRGCKWGKAGKFALAK